MRVESKMTQGLRLGVDHLYKMLGQPDKYKYTPHKVFRGMWKDESGDQLNVTIAVKGRK